MNHRPYLRDLTKIPLKKHWLWDDGTGSAKMLTRFQVLVLQSDIIVPPVYCNALLGGCPASSINKLQIVQNAAARVLTRSRKYDHITSILQSLHWLPIKFRISYKILLLTYKALNDLAPAYLTNLLSRYNPTRSVRSQNSGLLVVPRIAKSTKGGRTFSYLAPKLWNSIPDNIRGFRHTLSV